MKTIKSSIIAIIATAMLVAVQLQFASAQEQRVGSINKEAFGESKHITSSAAQPSCNAHFKFFYGSESRCEVLFTNALNPARTTYLWDFGDGETSALANPLHVYKAEGSYKVTLTVSEKDATSSSSARVYFRSQAPIKKAAAHINEISVYPNPTSGKFTVKLSGAISNGSLKIYNIVGEIIYNEQFTDNTITTKEISLNVPAGIYFAHINSGEKQYIEKVIIH